MMRTYDTTNEPGGGPGLSRLTYRYAYAYFVCTTVNYYRDSITSSTVKNSILLSVLYSYKYACTAVSIIVVDTASGSSFCSKSRPGVSGTGL